MNLNRRQVRLLMVSAGDHERLPKSKDDKTVVKDLKSVVAKQKIPDKYLKKLHKGIKHPKKWAILGEKDIDDVKVLDGKSNETYTPKNAEMRTLLDMARQSKSGFKMKNTSRTPIKKKR